MLQYVLTLKTIYKYINSIEFLYYIVRENSHKTTQIIPFTQNVTNGSVNQLLSRLSGHLGMEKGVVREMDIKERISGRVMKIF